MSDLCLEAKEIYADLQVMAMIFGMDIDVEIMKLVPKSDYQEPIWVTRWKEKRNGEDFDEYFDIDR